MHNYIKDKASIMNKQTKYDEQTRVRILKAAKKQFSNWGFAATRMTNIAKDAEVNKALIHYYFKNKEQLYKEVITTFLGLEHNQEVPIIIGSWDLTPPQKLYVLLYFGINVHFNATDPDIDRIILWELAEKNKIINDLASQLFEEHTALFMEILKEGIATGDFETKFPLWTIIQLFMFMVMYNNVSEFIHMLPNYVDLFKEEECNETTDFMIEQMFKVLRPLDKTVTIPTIPDDLMQLLDEIIEYIKQRKEQGLNLGIISKIKNILFKEQVKK